MKRHLAVLLALCAGPAMAESLSLDLNNDALRLNYSHDLSRNYTTDFAWVHVKELGNAKASGNAFTGGITLRQPLRGTDLTALIGGKVVLQQHDSFPGGTAIAVGGGLRFVPPTARDVGIVGTVYYAPNVLSFGNMANYTEFELRGEYTFSDQLTGYAGYRNNRADYDKSGVHYSDIKLYDGFMVGGEFRF